MATNDKCQTYNNVVSLMSNRGISKIAYSPSAALNAGKCVTTGYLNNNTTSYVYSTLSNAGQIVPLRNIAYADVDLQFRNSNSQVLTLRNTTITMELDGSGESIPGAYYIGMVIKRGSTTSYSANLPRTNKYLYAQNGNVYIGASNDATSLVVRPKYVGTDIVRLTWDGFTSNDYVNVVIKESVYDIYVNISGNIRYTDYSFYDEPFKIVADAYCYVGTNTYYPLTPFTTDYLYITSPTGYYGTTGHVTVPKSKTTNGTCYLGLSNPRLIDNNGNQIPLNNISRWEWNVNSGSYGGYKAVTVPQSTPYPSAYFDAFVSR